MGQFRKVLTSPLLGLLYQQNAGSSDEEEEEEEVVAFLGGSDNSGGEEFDPSTLPDPDKYADPKRNDDSR